MLPIFMLEIRYYVASDGHQPFAEWFADLEPVSRAKVARAIARMEQGNLSNVKSVGEGVLEYRIDFGPGYRVYFSRDGETLVILLTGGTKKREQRDIGNGDLLLAGLQAPQADVPVTEWNNGKNKELQEAGPTPRQE